MFHRENNSILPTRWQYSFRESRSRSKNYAWLDAVLTKQNHEAGKRSRADEGLPDGGFGAEKVGCDLLPAGTLLLRDLTEFPDLTWNGTSKVDIL